MFVTFCSPASKFEIFDLSLARIAERNSVIVLGLNAPILNLQATREKDGQVDVIELFKPVDDRGLLAS
nr:hypothetical protein HmN_000958100 [Hymenolepis microstoma]